MEAEIAPKPAQTLTVEQPRPVRLPPLWLLSVVSFILFVWTASRDVTDVIGYHCYALAFWGGRSAAATLPNITTPAPHRACLVALDTISVTPFHSFPAEYGPLALLAFLPPLIFPSAWYTVAFSVEMATVAIALAWLLHRFGAPGAGHVWLVYALVGGMILTAGRYDVLPAASVVVSLLAVRHKKLPLAYASMAIGTLLKFFPLALAPLLLIESWRARDREPLWRGPALFTAIVGVVGGIVAALDPSGALTPLGFMSARCVQVESVPATIGYLWASLIGAPLSFPDAFNSVCEQAPGLGFGQALCTVFSVAGLALVIWLFWRRALTLGLAVILTLALLIIGSKVFSPQYILWISPLVALEYGVEGGALFGWGAVCLWSTICFPMSYDRIPRLFHITANVAVPFSAAVRNVLLVALVGVILWRQSRAEGVAPRWLALAGARRAR